ncbi:MAG: hypothetical protein H0U70_03215 [Tatlockia sp.]|nr:hypothetical protein [Tatlockia sp.]
MERDKTIESISLALDAALLRQTAIASNIANANTKGYQPVAVNFEQQLGRGLSSYGEFHSLAASVEDSSIDAQIALSVKNATQFRALIKGLNQKLALMKLALHGNN